MIAIGIGAGLVVSECVQNAYFRPNQEKKAAAEKAERIFQNLNIQDINRAISRVCQERCSNPMIQSKVAHDAMASVLTKKIADLPKGDRLAAGLGKIMSYLCNPQIITSHEGQQKYTNARQLVNLYVGVINFEDHWERYCNDLEVINSVLNDQNINEESSLYPDEIHELQEYFSSLASDFVVYRERLDACAEQMLNFLSDTPELSSNQLESVINETKQMLADTQREFYHQQFGDDQEFDDAAFFEIFLGRFGSLLESLREGSELSETIQRVSIVAERVEQPRVVGDVLEIDLGGEGKFTFKESDGSWTFTSPSGETVDGVISFADGASGVSLISAAINGFKAHQVLRKYVSERTIIGLADVCSRVIIKADELKERSVAFSRTKTKQVREDVEEGILGQIEDGRSGCIDHDGNTIFTIEPSEEGESSEAGVLGGFFASLSEGLREPTVHDEFFAMDSDEASLGSSSSESSDSSGGSSSSSSHRTSSDSSSLEDSYSAVSSPSFVEAVSSNSADDGVSREAPESPFE